MLGDGPELIGTPGVPLVAVPRMLHHLTGERKRRGSRGKREEEKMRNEES